MHVPLLSLSSILSLSLSLSLSFPLLPSPVHTAVAGTAVVTGKEPPGCSRGRGLAVAVDTSFLLRGSLLAGPPSLTAGMWGRAQTEILPFLLRLPFPLWLPFPFHLQLPFPFLLRLPLPFLH